MSFDYVTCPWTGTRNRKLGCNAIAILYNTVQCQVRPSLSPPVNMNEKEGSTSPLDIGKRYRTNLWKFIPVDNISIRMMISSVSVMRYLGIALTAHLIYLGYCRLRSDSPP